MYEMQGPRPAAGTYSVIALPSWLAGAIGLPRSSRHTRDP